VVTGRLFELDDPADVQRFKLTLVGRLLPGNEVQAERGGPPQEVEWVEIVYRIHLAPPTESGDAPARPILERPIDGHVMARRGHPRPRNVAADG
jgi:hypothetical protein